MNRKLFLFAVLVLTTTNLFAFDFQYNGIFYKITSSVSPYEVSVTRGTGVIDEYSGDIIIPSSVNSNGITYSVTSIDDHCFMSFQNLTSITIPNSVTKIGFAVFTGSANLNIINLEPTNQYFDFKNGVLFNYTRSEIIFSIMNNSGVFDIPNSVTSIADAAFYYNYKLTSINIPSSVNSIGTGAFGLCTNLTTIYVKTELPLILTQSADVFSGVPLTTCVLYVPKGTKSAYQKATLWKDFVNIEEDNSTGIQSLSSNELDIKSKGDKIELSNLSLGEIIQIYTTDGKNVFSHIAKEHSILIQLTTNKTYIVKVGLKSKKIFL